MEFTQVLLIGYLINWIGCYVETDVRSGKRRFRSEAKLDGSQAGIHQANASFELIFHFPVPP
jgi:hypothetical protein